MYVFFLVALTPGMQHSQSHFALFILGYIYLPATRIPQTHARSLSKIFLSSSITKGTSQIYFDHPRLAEIYVKKSFSEVFLSV